MSFSRVERSDELWDFGVLRTRPREYLKGARWVEPELLVEVEYMNVTRHGILRHASFVGLRDDKAAVEVYAAVYQR